LPVLGAAPDEAFPVKNRATGPRTKLREDEEALHSDLWGETRISVQCCGLGGARKLADRLQGGGKIANPFAAHKFTSGGWNIMKRLLLLLALLSLSGLGIRLSAQQTPSETPSQPPSASDSQTPSAPDTTMPQSQTDATQAQQSARAFEGMIQKSGNQFVLQETTTQTSYQLDDQHKAKHFEGKSVKVMATIDASTNQLHVVDIVSTESR
jgi:Protein of unknown function (DUF5818)